MGYQLIHYDNQTAEPVHSYNKLQKLFIVCLFIKHYKRKIIICVNLGVILFMLLTSLAGISSRSKSSYSAQTHNEVSSCKVVSSITFEKLNS